MGEVTRIAWTDHTFNGWWGCTKVGNSPACDNCYAETWAHRLGYDIWGDDKPRRYFAEKHFDDLLKWDRSAQQDGVMRRVFVQSMGDWAEGRPEQIPYLDMLWERVLRTENLIFLMLTKRPQLIGKLCPIKLQRIWHGVTAENQYWLDLRWNLLKRVESPVYWLSMEPLMERVVLPLDYLALGPRGWVIVGGESGAKARQMDPKWAAYLRDQCVEANVPYFFKQWGEYLGPNQDGGLVKGIQVLNSSDEFIRVGTKPAGCLLDGREWKQFPEYSPKYNEEVMCAS